MSSQNLLRRTLLIFAFAAMTAAPATAQDSEPEFVPYVNDLQLFDQPDLSPYGRGPQPAAGYFGTAEYLNWTQSAVPLTKIGQAGSLNVINSGASTINTGSLRVSPTTTTIQLSTTQVTTSGGQTVTTTTFQSVAFSIIAGVPPIVPSAPRVSAGVVTVTRGGVGQVSSLDTTFMSSADYTSGGRYEFGHVDEDGLGWMLGGFNFSGPSVGTAVGNAAVNFENSPIGFADFRGVNTLTPDGIDDDLDNDGVYGRFGVDLGTTYLIGNPPLGQQGIEPLNGQPDVRSVATDFDDAATLPSKFETLRIENQTTTYGLELMKMWRVAMGPRGGVWEMFVGPRGMNVTDQFFFVGVGQAGSPGTEFTTKARNYLIGGQIGAKWSRTWGRWQLGAEGRFLAAANIQNVQQEGEIGSIGFGVASSQVINVQVPARFTHTVKQTEFAPAGELRLNLKYHLFRSFYLQAGYSGLFVDNIARGAQMTRYSLPTMGLLEDQNRTTYLLHGLNLGLVFNH